MVMLVTPIPSTMSSSTPVAVTVWGKFQSAEVKTKATGASVSSVKSFPDTKTTTLAVGLVSRATVKVSVVSSSET